MILSVLLLVLLTRAGSCLADCQTEEELSWTSYGYFQSCRSKHIKQALQENVLCRPSPVIVKLPLPNNTDIQQMTPTHVEVAQCGGACHRNSQGCVPTKTKEREVWVMVGRCGIQTGKCEKECASITVVEHLECGCDCREEERESCPQHTHRYNTDTCQCQCRDNRAKQECLDQGQSWSESSCQCECRQPSPCSDGLVFSNVTCTCLPHLSITRSASDGGDTREPRGSLNTDKFFSWQLIIILVLLVLIFILLVTIFSLISKLQSARRRIKAARAAAQNNQDLLYTERARPAGSSKELIVRTSKGDKAYSEVYCESPSSGFGSEGSKYSNTDLHVDNSATYRPPACAAPSSSKVSPGSESIYHTAETVRLNKKIQNNSPHQIYGARNLGVPPVPVMMASDPIDEAVRLLEHSAAMLQ